MTEDILRQLESEHTPRQRVDMTTPTLSPTATIAASVVPLSRSDAAGRALEAQRRAAETLQRRGRY